MADSRQEPNSTYRPLPKTITQDQFETLIALQPVERSTQRRNLLAIKVMWDAGLRISEVLDLAPGDLTRAGKYWALSVRHGKGAQPRHVYIGRNLAGDVVAWAKELPKGSRFLFPVLGGKNGGKRAMSDSYLRRVVRELSEQADVLKIRSDGTEAPINPHMFRHSYATELLQDGLSLREVQHQLGHKSISTTEIYTHIQNDLLGSRIETSRDFGKHVSAEVAARDQMALERRIFSALDGASSAVSTQEKVAMSLIAREVARLDFGTALRRLSTP